MALQFQEISKGETLWVESVTMNQDEGFSVTYTPAIVQHANYKEVSVKMGNVQPFSTDWLYGFFCPLQYAENPDFFPTTVRAEKTLVFEVGSDDMVKPIPYAKHALVRSPKRAIISPYCKINFKCDYGDFEPTANGFVNRVWEIEKERVIPRFSKPALRQFVENFFIEKMDGVYMQVRYPILFDAGVIYREEGNNFPYEDPSSRESILRFFFQRCIPYLADQNWFDLVRETGLVGLNYTESWRDLHRAFVVADQEGVDAISFIADCDTIPFTQQIADALKIPNNEIHIFVEPNTEKAVLQIRTQLIRDRLSVAGLSL